MGERYRLIGVWETARIALLACRGRRGTRCRIAEGKFRRSGKTSMPAQMLVLERGRRLAITAGPMARL
jgi:hypothetical protein